MRADPRGAAAALTFAAAAASVAYTAFAIVRVVAFGRRVARARRAWWPAGELHAMPALHPTITVLKPVRGVEPELVRNLSSFCSQRYPAYDVVLGVRDAGDPALPLLRHVAAAFPDHVSIVTGDGAARCRNPKIATLLPMAERTSGEIVVVADSDMRVEPDYLEAVAAAFRDPRVGAATALYRGEPADGGVASRLGAMWITSQFAPSVLVATAVEPLTYCFGSTMAVRRTVLERIGGLAALGNKLADDHMLGRLVSDAGFRVSLLPYVVENTVSEPSLRALVAHEVRWARTIRALRPASYAGIVLTYPLALAWLHFALAHEKRNARTLFSAALVLRAALELSSTIALGAKPRPPQWRGLTFPLRDALGIAVWLIGLTGRSVRWRDDALHFGPGGGLASDQPTA
jgi:ceramide glucosyltransferase